MSTIFGYKSRAVLFQYTWLGYFDEPLAHPDENLSGDCENIYMQQEDVYSRAFRNWLLNITQIVSYRLCYVNVLLRGSVFCTPYTTKSPPTEAAMLLDKRAWCRIVTVTRDGIY